MSDEAPDSTESTPSSVSRIDAGAEISAVVDGAVKEVCLSKHEDVWAGRAIAVPMTDSGGNRRSWLHAIVDVNTNSEPYWRASEHLSGDLYFDGQSWRILGHGRYV